jgi:hypothetical protein
MSIRGANARQVTSMFAMQLPLVFASVGVRHLSSSGKTKTRLAYTREVLGFNSNDKSMGWREIDATHFQKAHVEYGVNPKAVVCLTRLFTVFSPPTARSLFQYMHMVTVSLVFNPNNHGAHLCNVLGPCCIFFTPGRHPKAKASLITSLIQILGCR